MQQEMKHVHMWREGRRTGGFMPSPWKPLWEPPREPSWKPPALVFQDLDWRASRLPVRAWRFLLVLLWLSGSESDHSGLCDWLGKPPPFCRVDQQPFLHKWCFQRRGGGSDTRMSSEEQRRSHHSPLHLQEEDLSPSTPGGQEWATPINQHCPSPSSPSHSA